MPEVYQVSLLGMRRPLGLPSHLCDTAFLEGKTSLSPCSDRLEKPLDPS